MCAILNKPEILLECRLSHEDFHRPGCKTIYRALHQLRDDGTKIDLVTLTQLMADWNLLVEIGGASLLADILTMEAIACNWREYAITVIKKSKLRKVIHDTESAASKAYEPGANPDEIVADVNECFRKLQIVPKKFELLTFRTISEILKMEFSDADLYLANGYLQKGGSLAIIGAGGLGKSRLVIQLAICSAAGLPFLGWEIRGKPKWLFLQTENGNRRLQYDLSKITALCSEKDLAHLDDRLVFHTIEYSVDVLLRPSGDKARTRLQDAIEQHDPDIVVFDVLRDFAVGDLNSDEGMTDTLDTLGRIVRSGRPDRGIVIIHHARTGKAAAAGAFGLDRSNFGRNSKVLLGWARAVLNLAPLSEEEEDLIGSHQVRITILGRFSL